MERIRDGPSGDPVGLGVQKRALDDESHRDSSSTVHPCKARFRFT